MEFRPELFTAESREGFIYDTLKRKVHNFLMIRPNENDYFDIGEFFRKYNIRKQSDIDKYITRIVNDIRSSGWNCGTSFYKTGLFVFGDTRPPNFFPDTDEF